MPFLSNNQYVYTFESNKSTKQDNEYFYFIINSFIFTSHHYSPLFVTVRHYSSLFVTVRHYSSLFVTIRHYSSLFVTVRHYSSLFVTIHHCSSLFITVRDFSHYSVAIRVFSLANRSSFERDNDVFVFGLYIFPPQRIYQYGSIEFLNF